jgi:hypothetical protein
LVSTSLGIDEKHADVVLPQLGAPALGHAADRELAAVVGRAVGRATERSRRREIDDVAALALDEVLRRFARHQHSARHVGPEDGLELRHIHVDELAAHAEAGAVDQDVEVAELVEELAVGALDVVLAADVGLDRVRRNGLRASFNRLRRGP